MKHDYPTKFDKLEVYYDHMAMYNHTKPMNRIRRPRTKKKLHYLSPAERYLFK